MNTLIATGLAHATGMVAGAIVVNSLTEQVIENNPYIVEDENDDEKVKFKKSLTKFGIGLGVLGLGTFATIVTSNYLESRWTDDDYDDESVPQLEE